MELLVEFEVNVPDRTPVPEVKDRQRAEAAAAAKLADQGHLVRVWNQPAGAGNTTIVGLYRADSQAQLDGLLGVLPLHAWMHLTVTPLQPHPNDPAGPARRNQLPAPRLTQVYRLEAALGQPQELGDTTKGHRRIVPLTAGTFTGPGISGKLLPGASADWQVVLPDGTALGDVRSTLQPDRGELLYVRSWGIRHGSAEVLARLGRGEDVDASEYSFRSATRIETGTSPTTEVSQMRPRPDPQADAAGDQSPSEAASPEHATSESELRSNPCGVLQRLHRLS
jgi:muconolactone delta-isomerase